MRVCVFGAGAVGGHAAARMIATDAAEVSVIARGPHLEAIRERGLTLKTEGRELHGRPVQAEDDASKIGPQDLVIVALKAHSQPAVARDIAQLLAPGGVALFGMNGIQWWWRYGRPDAGPLETIDPGGALWRAIGPERALGGVVQSSNQVIEPGVIVHTGSRRWTIGEPDGSMSERAQRVADLLNAAGMEGSVTSDIRREVWRKLMTNISSNPIAGLTRLTAREMQEVKGLDVVAKALIAEALLVAKADGSDLTNEITPDGMVNPSRGRSGGKSSMLQDVEAGRALEVDALMTQVQEFARQHNIATPTIDTVRALLAGLDHALRLARGG
ncbi:MAG: ketopantoate reductase family protein [Beijerinckiaceae bacterium]